MFSLSFSNVSIAETAALMRSSSQTALSTAWCLFHFPVCLNFFHAGSKLTADRWVFMAISPMLLLWAASIALFSFLSPYFEKSYRNMIESIQDRSDAA